MLGEAFHATNLHRGVPTSRSKVESHVLAAVKTIPTIVGNGKRVPVLLFDDLQKASSPGFIRNFRRVPVGFVLEPLAKKASRYTLFLRVVSDELPMDKGFIVSGKDDDEGRVIHLTEGPGVIVFVVRYVASCRVVL